MGTADLTGGGTLAPVSAHPREAAGALAAAITLRDADTGQHSADVTRLAVRTGRGLGLSAAELDDLELAAPLHDLGKIGVPEAILRKAGPLTDGEWQVMRRHSEWGAEILERISGLEAAARLVRHHHERYDGQGYPGGLAADEIPLGGRILSACDAYGAMVCTRPYRPALAPARARMELLAGAGSRFDPDVAAAVASALGRGEGEGLFGPGSSGYPVERSPRFHNGSSSHALEGEGP